MANNTTEYWDIDGVSLHQYGWSVATLSGTRYGVPPLRGENTAFAYVAGREFRRKIPDSRVLTLAMWMTGTNPGTGVPSADQRRQWNDNWAALRSLMWTPNREFALTRRWSRTDILNQPSIQVATAAGQYAGGLDPTMTGRTRADFTVDILLADPFFYGDPEAANVSLNTPRTVFNPGDFDAAQRHFSIVFIGPLTNPRLVNSSPTPDVWVGYGANISAGQTLTLDVEQFAATASAPEVSIPELSLNRVGYISHAGARNWFGLLPGDNVLTLTADAGSGSALVTYRPPYI